MFEVGKKYRGGADSPYLVRECWAIREGGKYGWLTARNSTTCPFGTILEWNSRYWTEVRDPVTAEGWVNVYSDSVRRSKMHATKAEADAAAMPSRIACVYVTGTEGKEPD